MAAEEFIPVDEDMMPIRLQPWEIVECSHPVETRSFESIDGDVRHNGSVPVYAVCGACGKTLGYAGEDSVF